MRILYVSRETPLHPAGGIATYLDYMIPAMEAAGHDVFLFTWTETFPFVEPLSYAPFRRENVHIEHFSPTRAWFTAPAHAHNLVVASYLAEKILAKMREWEIEVVEATDYLAPCLAAFQKAQTRTGARTSLLATYNHGLIEVVTEADQIGYHRGSLENNLCERQQCRISDIVVAPSEAARRMLIGMGLGGNIERSREPFAFRSEDESFAGLRDKIQYIGRLSVQKGIDKIVYLANLLHPIYPLRQIELIGRVGHTPFRNPKLRDYVTKRLSPELRDCVSFTDFLPREKALARFEPGAIGPNLGTNETFSYACIEAIDHGLVPIVREQTAMAEFFPEDLRHHILDGEMRSVSKLQEQLGRILENAENIVGGVRAHCRETLDPGRIAEQMGQIYDKALTSKRGRKTHAVACPPATIADVTVLIPAYNPNHEFFETVDSLAWQTAGAPKVLICDDGTLETHQPWFDYAPAVLPECRILRQPNSGLLAARNTLIDACETKLAIFLDTDDILAPELLENLLEAWNRCTKALDAVIPQRRNFGESSEAVLRHLLDDHLHILENDYRMTALIRTEVLREIGFDATRRNGEGDDWAFWLEFTARGYTGVMLPEQGFLYRFRTGSMSWPWSLGQNVGTQTMVREAVLKMCNNEPERIAAVARALFTRNVFASD